MALELRGKYGTPMFVSGELFLFGMTTAPVTVRKGGKLILHGIITADLIVEPQGTAVVYGMVNGTTFNRGGRLEVYGIVEALDGDGVGSTIVGPEAIVRGPTYHPGLH